MTKIPLYDDDDLKATVDDWQVFNDILLKYRADAIVDAVRRYYPHRGFVLDVGCGNGEIVKRLSDAGRMVRGIDPDTVKIDRARKNLSRGLSLLAAGDVFDRFVIGDIETLQVSKLYQTIICSHVIEHSENPYTFLNACRKHLQYGGFIIVTCPNALALHKRIGNVLDLSTLYGLSPTDDMQDHKHTFDREMLRALLVATGFDVIEEQGLMLKPFTSSAMAKYLDPRYFDAFFEVGKDEVLIDYCSSILIVGQKK